MSGSPSCAIVEWSINSTPEWMILWGCTTTSICSGSTSNKNFASITSSPLFINVAESMVIFLPIDQFGWLSASAMVTVFKYVSSFPLKGPPEAVNIILCIALFSFAIRHWKIALCSLSTGRIGELYFFDKSIMYFPPVTNVSLLARAIIFPFLIAAIVGFKPIIPETAVTIISLLSNSATEIKPSILETISVFIWEGSMFFSFNALFSSITQHNSGLNSIICCFKSSILLFPEIALTLILSECSLTTSNVWVPIEPVEPSILIYFMIAPCFLYNEVFLW